MGFLRRTNLMIFVTVTIMVICLSCFHSVSGLQCFACMSPRAPSDWTGTEDVARLKILPDCKDEIEETVRTCSVKLKHICAKTDTTIDGQKYVIRRCEEGKAGECKEDKADINGKIETGRICFCNTNKCNGGNSFKNYFSKNYILFLGTIFIITRLYWS